jgi:NADH dehydrogenase [ubiquinone] 1 alpha subcomplex assembly factor 7
MAGLEKQARYKLMQPLEQLIRDIITKNGPMPFARFMETCLFHETHGYYNTHDPLNDFTTAPEISQLFGEMITLWCIDVWMKLGSPARFTLVECGPGRGTLMADVLRTAKIAPAFLNAADCVMLEKSPYLKGKQQALLKEHKVSWVGSINELPAAPVIMFCNELFDAFPVQPFVKTENGWAMRGVGIIDDELAYTILPTETGEQFKDGVFIAAPIGAITEVNSAANAWLTGLAQHVKLHGGAGLLIDYGYAGPICTNTVQAIHNKKMSPVLKHIGQADITAHVDFTPFKNIAEQIGVHCSALNTMRDFLMACGIELRAERLKSRVSVENQAPIDAGLSRLIAPEQMGHLFKVLCLYQNTISPPIGCEP